MTKKGSGFTIIELIIVVAIIAILFILVVTKFFNFSSNAQQNVIANLASRLNSAARMNYYARTLDPGAGIPITNCRNVPNAMQSALPSGYSVASRGIPQDTIVSCVLRGPNNSTANFYARGIK